MEWDERRVVNGDMGTGDEDLEEYRSGLSYFCARSLLLVMRVSNDLYELLQTCKQCVYFCEHEQ